MAQTALAIPEIVAAIGKWIPLWSFDRVWTEFTFTPTTLARCTLVNHLWRQTLFPILWYTFDDYFCQQIDPLTLQKYSPHFRLFIASLSSCHSPMKIHMNDFDCSQVKTLHLFGWVDYAIVSKKYPALKELRWLRLRPRGKEDQVEGFLKALAPTLVSLALPRLDPEDHAWVLRLVRKLPRLRVLSLDGVDVDWMQVGEHGVGDDELFSEGFFPEQSRNREGDLMEGL